MLFVCTANICRSATMELLARRTLSGQVDLEFSSAGTHAVDGRTVDAAMAEAIGTGPDADAFRSRRLTPQVLARADLVLTAEVAHRRWILDDAPDLVRSVFTLAQFADAVRDAPEAGDRDLLLARTGAQRGPADPAGDVADPYRRGPQAARGCADRIGELLQVVLPALTDTN